MSNPFDMGGMGGLGGLGAMFGGLQQKMADMKAQVARTEVDGSAGGLVKVRMNGEFTVLSLTIDPKAMDDREMLEDLVRAAVNDASDKARAEMANQMKSLMGGLPIPPGLLGF